MERNEIIRILELYSIDYWTSGKNVSDNSVNIQCPFCNDHSNHCGIFYPSGVYHCWRCDSSGPFSRLISEITQLSENQIKELIETEGVDFKRDSEDQIKDIFRTKQNDKEKPKNTKVELPKHIRKITTNIWSPLLHAYLKRRNIDIQTCIDHRCYVCDVGEYENRLIIPIYFGGRLVSFQGADMTGHAYTKYKSAKGNLNDYLYNYDNIEEIIIVTEGIFDCWRVGNNAVATFGTFLTNTQKSLIIERNPELLIFAWDSDAYWKAKEQAEYFKPFIKEVETVKLPDGHDPDSLGHSEVWKLINQVVNL